jgi:hypothetical protein
LVQVASRLRGGPILTWWLFHCSLPSGESRSFRTPFGWPVLWQTKRQVEFSASPSRWRFGLQFRRAKVRWLGRCRVRPQGRCGPVRPR